MTKPEIEIQDSMLLDSPASLRQLSDPLRLNLITHIRGKNRMGKTCTVKELSEKLNVPQTKLYYHINLLEKHAIIKVHHTELVSGIPEKHYQVTARRYYMDRDIFRDLPEDKRVGEILKTINALTQQIYTDLESSLLTAQEQDLLKEDKLEEEDFTVTFRRSEYNLTREQLLKMMEEITAVMEKYDQISEDNQNSELTKFLFYLVNYEKFE